MSSPQFKISRILQLAILVVDAGGAGLTASVSKAANADEPGAKTATTDVNGVAVLFVFDDTQIVTVTVAGFAPVTQTVAMKGQNQGLKFTVSQVSGSALLTITVSGTG